MVHEWCNMLRRRLFRMQLIYPKAIRRPTVIIIAAAIYLMIVPEIDNH